MWWRATRWLLFGWFIWSYKWNLFSGEAVGKWSIIRALWLTQLFRLWCLSFAVTFWRLSVAKQDMLGSENTPSHVGVSQRSAAWEWCARAGGGTYLRCCSAATSALWAGMRWLIFIFGCGFPPVQPHHFIINITTKGHCDLILCLPVQTVWTSHPCWPDVGANSPVIIYLLCIVLLSSPECIESHLGPSAQLSVSRSNVPFGFLPKSSSKREHPAEALCTFHTFCLLCWL